jgi:hypothetical protein
MVQILRAEIKYNLKLIVGFFLFLPVTWLLSFNTFEDLSPNYIMFWLMFVMVQSWNSIRNKEIREYQQAALPLVRNQVALARLSMVVVLSLVMISTHFIAIHLIQPGRIINLTTVMLPFSILLFMFSLYYLLRNRLLYFLRHNRIFKITKERTMGVLMIMVFLGVIFGMLGMVAFMDRPTGITTVVDFVMAHNPFSGEFGFEKLFILSLVLSGLTIVTFNHRKSYLE